MVIAPNSHIGQNHVVNHSYPGPQYLIMRQVHIAYGTDVEMARQIIVDTVRQVEGVVLDRSAGARYDEMGDAAVIFSVEWWVESKAEQRPVIDRENSALQEALDAAGIEMPYATRNVNLQVEASAIQPLSRAFGGHSPGPVED